MRKEFKNIESLAASIKELGLIEPVVVEQINGEYWLLAGQRRLKAHLLLGLTEIEAVEKNNLDDWHRRAIELEENIQRENLSWSEEEEGIAEVHKLYQEKFGQAVEGKKDSGWRIEDTAEMLGKSVGRIHQALTISRALETNPDLADKDSKDAAYKAITVKKDQLIKQEIAEVFLKLARENGQEDVEIRLGDSRLLLREYPNESFDFSVIDPPYGIGVHDMQNTFPQRGEVRQGIEFDDSRGQLEDVVKPVMKEVHRLLKDDSHLYLFFGIARYTQVRQLLEEIGFWVNPCPVLWIKNNALNLRPWLTFPVNYEPCFQCSKKYPPRPFNEIQKLSTFEHPILAGKVHPTQKPLEMIKWLVGLCSQKGERGIDPFLGSGTFTLACKELGRRAVGVELDKVWYFEAMNRLNEPTKQEE
jgi:site-specific DNA-methyltransferase (adenine-specific)